jgi:hypothetical protein
MKVLYGCVEGGIKKECAAFCFLRQYLQSKGVGQNARFANIFQGQPMRARQGAFQILIKYGSALFWCPSVAEIPFSSFSVIVFPLLKIVQGRCNGPV